MILKSLSGFFNLYKINFHEVKAAQNYQNEIDFIDNPKILFSSFSSGYEITFFPAVVLDLPF